MSSGSTSTMDGASNNPEKDSVIFGGLFQTIINDLRGSSPVWEDFTCKSVKLHSSLKTTVVAVGAFLEAFQKVADMATSSKGATREIGSALTRLCMRHRNIEGHLKALTSSILDNLVAPLQEKLEDWKKVVAQLDKDHSRENKKAKQDIKKAASDTIRLQKKVRKGSTHGKSDMQQKLDTAMIEVNSKYHQLEETEKNCVRSALIEERSRFCLFITCLKPFVDQELKLLTEMTHINEIMESLCMQASEPSVLPQSSEQVILDLKGVDTSSFTFSQAYQQSSPPSSPSSLGSRKSSMCSINSVNSSSSGSSHSPSHTIHKHHHASAKQPLPSTVRLTSVSSQDSGFTSQDTLFLCLNHPPSLSLYQNAESQERDGDCDSTPTTPSDNTPSASSTWNNWPNLPGNQRKDPSRPHTISSAYEKGHTRPALKPDIFEAPLEVVEMRQKTTRSQSQSNSRENRPSATISKMQPVLPPHCPKPKVKAIAPPMLPPGVQPIYANMADLKGSQSDLSPDDGEPTTPTTPASVCIAQDEATSEPSSVSSSLLSVVVVQPEQRMMALEEAMVQMDLCTASLGYQQEQTSDGGGHITPGSSGNDSSAELATTGVDLDIGHPTDTGDGEMVVDGPRVKIQQNTSLELAKAIRELEASTAALTSAYDAESYAAVANHTTVTSTTTATGDTDSYTSKMSLQCSSGYGTMNSTPAGSEDTIASGGISVSGVNISRRSSVNTQKPPPPIRRTASVSGASSQGPMSSVRYLSTDGLDSTYATGGGEGLVESPYAELQLIQQRIHDQGRIQPAPGMSPKLTHYQRHPGSADPLQAGTPSSATSDASYLHSGVNSSGGAGQFLPQGPTLINAQGSNIKFTTQNNQHQNDRGSDAVSKSGGAEFRGQAQKTAPQVMQKPKAVFPPPPSATIGQTTQLCGPTNPQHSGKIQQQQHFARQLQQQQHLGPYSDPNSYQQGRVLAAHPEEDFPLPPSQEELQEMERMFNQQKQQQPPMGQLIRAPAQHQKQMRYFPPYMSTQQMPGQAMVKQQPQQHHHLLQQHHHHQQQQRLPLNQPHQQPYPGLQQLHHPLQQIHQHQEAQASLMMELKKRVSIDETSDA